MISTVDKQAEFRVPEGRVDLTNCDREPIHVPSAIQPHGMLVAARDSDRKIAYVSANSQAFLGLEPAALLGRELADVLGAEAVAAIESAKYDLAGIAAARLEITFPPGNGPSYHAHLHRFDGMLLLELEPSSSERRWSVLAKMTEEVIDRLKRAQTLAELCASSAVAIRKLIGYDHVMIYKFHEDGHGEVIAEDRGPASPTFLHFHFPASDIPAQARALHLLQRTRMVPDVHYRPVPLLGDPELAQGRPLDMTYSRLRSVSPMHIQYLKNMGVAASFAISIIHDQKLWGTIICHHQTPRLMPVELRSLCDLLGQVVSMLTKVTESNDRYAEHLAYRGKLDLFGTLMPPTLLLAESLAENSEVLLRPVGATGALLRIQGRTQLVGATPDLEDALAVMGALRERLVNGIFATDDLGEAMPEFSGLAATASGVLMISVGDSPNEGVLWFREEVVKTTLWGGNPAEAKVAAGEATISPRLSFSAWGETQFGRSAPWKEGELALALDFQRILTNSLHLRHADERAHLSYLDILTNLPNRRALLDRLGTLGDRLWAGESCLIFIDIDRFKMVNDTLGHQAGDELLIQVAQRLTKSVGAEHLVARLGGDEFVVFCENLKVEDARLVAARIVETFQTPFVLKDRPFRCATSIGLAAANGGGMESIADILHAADSAMYAAKQLGGNQFVVFENPLHEQLMRQVQLEQDLFQAIERGEMSAHFQPQVSVDDHRLIGFEALLRWRHPVYGNVPPSEFIPMAEYSGHIQQIGAWVLRHSLRQIGIWHKRFNPDLFVAVNVSMQQMASSDFVSVVREALRESGLPPHTLLLEVTESMLMQSSTEEQLEAIQALGVGIAIDDFGTGYSSLSYLPRLAVSTVKLDRTFLDGVGVDRRKTALFGAIVGMAHTLNIEVVAEGIEEAAQLECLREHSCDSAQGYLLSKPIPAERVEQLLVNEWRDGYVPTPLPEAPLVQA
jgi:diguanylate cyclase (GGDEF)-like protein